MGYRRSRGEYAQVTLSDQTVLGRLMYKVDGIITSYKEGTALLHYLLHPSGAFHNLVWDFRQYSQPQQLKRLVGQCDG